MAAASFNTKQDRPHLVRAVGLTSLTALAVNGMVGSGIFVLPAQVAAIVGPASLLAYGIAGSAAGLMVLCFAEVAALFDGSGGPYLYARAAFGDWVGFEIGWMLLLSRLSAGDALLCLAAFHVRGGSAPPHGVMKRRSSPRLVEPKPHFTLDNNGIPNPPARLD